MATLFDDSALYGEPWLVASELRLRSDATRCCCAPRRSTKPRLRARFPEALRRARTACAGTRARAHSSRSANGASTASCSTRKPAGRVDPAQAARRADRRRARARPRGAAVERIAAAVARTRALPARLGAGARLARSVRRSAARHARRLARAGIRAARRAWMRSTPPNLSKHCTSRLDWNAAPAASTRSHRRASPCPRAWSAASSTPSTTPTAHGRPVLAVKLQELFGLADTPRIADGRVPLTLHLLSPGGKPLQVTQDLRGFWERTYPEVQQGNEGPLSAPSLAGRSVVGRPRPIAPNRAAPERPVTAITYAQRRQPETAEPTIRRSRRSLHDEHQADRIAGTRDGPRRQVRRRSNGARAARGPMAGNRRQDRCGEDRLRASR